MDRMYMRNIGLKCIIGTKPQEREQKQDVIVNVMLECDLSPACRSDRLGDTVNFKTLHEEIVDLAETSRFFLIEKMAERIAEICLHNRKISVVRVTVDKPGALPGAGSAAVEIERRR